MKIHVNDTQVLRMYLWYDTEVRYDGFTVYLTSNNYAVPWVSLLGMWDQNQDPNSTWFNSPMVTSLYEQGWTGQSEGKRIGNGGKRKEESKSGNVTFVLKGSQNVL